MKLFAARPKIAASVLILASQANACLRIYGSASVEFTGKMHLTFVDNGVVVCEGSGKSSAVLNCQPGYWAWVRIITSTMM